MRQPWRFFLALISLGLLTHTHLLGAVYDYGWEDFAGEAGGLGHLDATGTAAQFVYPEGVATDGSGNVYVADTGNHVIREITPLGVVSTIAGTAGVTGTDDGTGPSAEFNAPAGIAATKDGTLYIADTGNNTIRRISPAGVVTTLAGQPRVSGTSNGFGSLAQFNAPSALALDGSGAIYVADTTNDTIRKVTFLGNVTTVAGQPLTTGTNNGAGSAALFHHPRGIALDNAHARFLIADTGNDTIRALAADGEVTTFSGAPKVSGTSGGSATNARFNKPVGIVVVSKDLIYVADSGNDQIRRLTQTGAVDKDGHGGKAGFKGNEDGHGPAARFDEPTGLAVNAAGTLYVADTLNSTIRAITPGSDITIPPGSEVSTFAGQPTIPGSADGAGKGASFDHPAGITAQPGGPIYIADTGNDIIRIATREGVVTTLAGSPHAAGSVDNTGPLARFDHPAGIAVSPLNNFAYVADTGNDTVRVVTSGSQVITYAGTADVAGTDNGVTSVALFNHPSGIAFDKTGDIYIADTGNDTIREIDINGNVSTFAGTPGVSGTDDGPGANALFNKPEGIYVDGTNCIYVADTQNQTIRRITFAGVVSTYAGSPGHRGSDDGYEKARFNNPAGIVADDHGDVFVADTGNDTIREITPDKKVSHVSTIGGVPGLIGSALGVGPAANFYSPRGIAISPKTGTLFVADSFNNRILKGNAATPSVRVIIEPKGARVAGAQWLLDGGPATNNSGVTLSGQTVGNHALSFTTIPGFITPPDQNVYISGTGTAIVKVKYIREFGIANVTILPQAAVDGTAMWKVEGKSYASGSNSDDLTAGDHTILFTYIPGYNPPAPQPITITAGQTTYTTGTYTPWAGSLMVNILPAAAATAGGEWYVDNGSPQVSGTTVSGLSVGQHTVYFTPATDYDTPAPQVVTIFNKQTTVTTGTYIGIPVISLQQPAGTPLQNNVSTVNFGPVVSGSTAGRQFAVVDVGTAPLVVTSVTVQGSDRFVATPISTGTIAVGGTATFTVNCTPIGFAAITAGLDVASNDPATPQFDVGLAATGTNGPVTFSGGAGSYAGLLSGTGNSVRGYAGLTLTAKGAVTGKLYLDGVSTAVKGAFATNGSFSGTPFNLGMVLTSGSGGPLNPAGYQMISNAASNNGSVAYIAYHAAYTAVQSVKEYTKYTLIMNGTDTDPSIPQGSSYATLVIPKKGGTVSFTGKLADGTPLVYSTFIASGPYGHQILLFDSALYNSKGFVGGPLTFEPRLDTDCDGIVQWVKPPAISKTNYPGGINTLLTAGGAEYILPTHVNPPIPITDGTFIISDGGLPAPDAEGVVLFTTDRLLFTGANPNNIKVTINGAAGNFTGTFLDPVTLKSTAFSGVLYQNNNDPGAAGFFLAPIVTGSNARGLPILSGTTLSGNVTLIPAVFQ